MRQINGYALEAVRRNYPAGCRVELLRMDDAQAPDAGTLGTVKFVDDTGTIHVAWDSGSNLGVVYGEDECRKVEEPPHSTSSPLIFHSKHKSPIAKMNLKCLATLDDCRAKYLERYKDTSLTGRIRTSMEKLTMCYYLLALSDCGYISKEDRQTLEKYYTRAEDES